MPIVVAKEITATVAGRRLEAVTCEKCRTRFFYELTRVGTGKGSALYYLGQQSATNRANNAAEEDLEQRLATETEVVPCPTCYWVNQDLVDRYRRQLYRRAPLLIVIAFVGLLIAAVIAPALLTDVVGYNSRIPGAAFLTLAAASVLSPAWVLLLRHRLRLRLDPNATHPRRPSVPPGTPPALVEQRDPQTGEVVLRPISSQDEFDVGRRNWAEFRPGQIVLPPVCCVCMAAATEIYAPPLRVNENSDLAVPLCSDCQSRLRVRWWLTLIAVSLASVAVAAIIAVSIPHGDDFARWALGGIIAFFGALFGGVLIAAWTNRPYRLRVVDADRGIVRFAAINSGFTERLIVQIRASEGFKPL